MDEQELVKLYMDLTGTAEPAARNVFMMICGPSGDGPESEQGTKTEPTQNGQRQESNQRGRASTAAVGLCLAFLCLVPNTLHAAVPTTNAAPLARPFGGPLSLADAINFALRQSPSILRAQKDLEASQGIAIQTKAIALPTLGVTAGYTTAQRTDVDVIEVPGFTLGTPQN